MNGEPDTHPLHHVGQMISDHATLIRRRLHAAHLQDGLPPENPERKGIDPLDLVRQTKSTNYSHLAALKAKFDRNGGSRG